jgi:hypothetical protein
MRIRKILKELKEHIPFTFLAVVVSIGVVVFVKYYFVKELSEEFFHFFHFSHIIVSAMVTGALYYKYKEKIINALAVGFSGALIIGSLSDIIFPYLGGLILGLDIHFHLPLVEETASVLIFAFIGSLAGVILKITKFPHFAHVFLSVFASLFYILIFSPVFVLSHFVGAFFIVFLAVIIPCCVSDIIFPLLFIKHKP